MRTSRSMVCRSCADLLSVLGRTVCDLAELRVLARLLLRPLSVRPKAHGLSSALLGDDRYTLGRVRRFFLFETFCSLGVHVRDTLMSLSRSLMRAGRLHLQGVVSHHVRVCSSTTMLISALVVSTNDRIVSCLLRVLTTLARRAAHVFAWVAEPPQPSMYATAFG